MSLYEHVLITRQDLTGQQVESLTEELSKIIADNDGKVLKSEQWGLRPLAYRVKKNRKGHYVMLHIDAPSAAVAEMERQIRINEDIIRHLTLRMDELEEGESVIMRNKSSRDERGDRPRFNDNQRGDRKPETTGNASAASTPSAESAPEAKTEDTADKTSEEKE